MIGDPYCSCGTKQLNIGRMRDGTQITKCPHCDVPLVYQLTHPADLGGCHYCYRYDRHASRIFPK